MYAIIQKKPFPKHKAAKKVFISFGVFIC